MIATPNVALHSKYIDKETVNVIRLDTYTVKVTVN